MPTIRYGEISDMRMVTGPVRRPTVSSVGTVPRRHLKQLSGKAAVSNRRPTLHVWLYLPMALHVSRATLNSIKHSAYTNGLLNQLADQRLASINTDTQQASYIQECKRLPFIGFWSLMHFVDLSTHCADLILYYAVVTCKIKLFWNNTEIFQCFISHVTSS